MSGDMQGWKWGQLGRTHFMTSPLPKYPSLGCPGPDILYLCHTCQDTHARHAPPGTTYVTSTNYHIFIYLHSCHIWNLLCYLFFWPRSVNVLQVCSLKNFSSWAREASRKTDTYLPPPSALGGSHDPKKTIYIQILWYRFNIKLSHFNLRFI